MASWGSNDKNMSSFGSSYQQKMSAETFAFVCTACADDNKTLEAVKYCVECSGYCCQACVDTHKKFPPLRKHNLIEVSQANQASGQQSDLQEFPTERCSLHKGKVVDMYCDIHDAVGCYVCIAKDHKSCQDSHIHSIPDVIDTLFKLSDCQQTQSLMKDMVVAMETESKSKDTQRQALHKAKKDALDKVDTFQKALESILRKKAESTRQEVEGVYTHLEKAILGKQQTVDNIRADLKTTNDKLDDSDGNRAQHFVCTKIGQGKIKEACDMKTTSLLQYHADITIIPDQTLMEFIGSLQGICQVQKYGEHKQDLYHIIRTRDFNIKLPDDSNSCRPYGCCLTHDNQLLVTDRDNKKLKRIDIQNMSVLDYCVLEYKPYGVCSISEHEVVVACKWDNIIQFVSLQTTNKMTPTIQIKLTHCCHGIVANADKLYVTDNKASVFVYAMSGTLLKTITQDVIVGTAFCMSRHITFNETGDRMFVCGWRRGLVCFDGMGNFLSNVTDSNIDRADGVCVDKRGNVFVAGYGSHNVVQVSENGKKVGVVVKQGEGLKQPRSVCFHPGLNLMFVTMNNSEVVKVYELE